jgi:hypothetical protein
MTVIKAITEKNHKYEAMLDRIEKRFDFVSLLIIYSNYTLLLNTEQVVNFFFLQVFIILSITSLVFVNIS